MTPMITSGPITRPDAIIAWCILYSSSATAESLWEPRRFVASLWRIF